MNCPKCDARMETVTFHGVQVDRCTGCQGLWFDGLEHRRLKEMEGAEIIDTGTPLPRDQRDRPGVLLCPRDRGRLIRMVDTDQRHIRVESCSVCHGVFFDAGEFRDLKEETVGDFFRNLFDKEPT